MDELQAIIDMGREIFDISWGSFWLAESSMIKSHSLNVVLCQLVSYVCSMTNVGVESVKHDD